MVALVWTVTVTSQLRISSLKLNERLSAVLRDEVLNAPRVARLVNLDLPHHARIVSNEAGITGGIKLWDAKLDQLFT